MRSKSSKILMLLLITAMAFCMNSPVIPQSSDRAENLKTADGLVKELYSMCTFKKDALPDWEKMKDLFIENAVIVLRSTRTSFEVMDKEGFVKAWLRDINQHGLGKTGFSETILKSKTIVMGDISHCYVLYEWCVPIDRNPQPKGKGIDSIQMMKKDGRWWIVGITNEALPPGSTIKLPEELK